MGTVSAALTNLVCYPLDYARVRLAADVRPQGGEHQFSGILDVWLKTLAHDGVRGLYRGFLPALAGLVVYPATYFMLSNSFKRTSPPTMLYGAVPLFCLAYCASIAANLASYPFITVCRRIFYLLPLTPPLLPPFLTSLK
jgi:solute carrier family 25 (adenine nucleotide translocator) protein 4/5/6/31